MGFDAEDIKEILRLFDESDWAQLDLEVDGFRLAVSKDDPLPARGATPAASPAPVPLGGAAPPVDQPVDRSGSGAGSGIEAAMSEEMLAVVSPTIGRFWRAPEPGARPFVEVGQSVAEGDVLCIVEVMKLMSHLRADTPGEIIAIRPENGQAVESGDVLFLLRPVES